MMTSEPCQGGNAACPVMPLGFKGGVIEPTWFYSEEELIVGWAFSEACLSRGRRLEGLRFKDIGYGRRSYLGSWVLAWLNREQADEGGQTPCQAGEEAANAGDTQEVEGRPVGASAFQG